MSSTRSHRHLARQLRKLGLDEGALPTAEGWQAFLAAVSESYEDIDRERYALERSVTLFEREMRKLNANLEAERDRMRLVFEAAPIGIIRLELSGVVTMVNPALERMLGYTAAELLAMNPVDLVHPGDHGAGAAWLASLRSGRVAPSYVARRRLPHKSGITIEANVSVSTACDAEKRPLFALALVEDISEKARLEVELRHAQKLESVGRLASGIAHELNTPIQFIGDNTGFLQSAFADLLLLCNRYREMLHQLDPHLQPEQRELLRAVEEEADLAFIRENAGGAFTAALHGVDRVSTIVRAMKAFAHPDQGQKSLADINAAMRNTLTVGANEIKYVADVETDFGDLALLPCYLGDLNQVFLNLLVNASHAIGDVVKGTGLKGKIRVRTFAEADHVVISIGDTGGGIPEGVRQRIFEPFFTTKEVGRGTGQGLAISRAVVEKHGGTLTFESEVGKGTTFTIRLPIPAASGTGAGSTAGATSSSGVEAA